MQPSHQPLPLRKVNTLPLSKSALKQKFYAELKSENMTLFAKSPRCVSPYVALTNLPHHQLSRNWFITSQDAMPVYWFNSARDTFPQQAPVPYWMCGLTHLPCLLKEGQESVLHFLVTCLQLNEPFRRHLRNTLKHHASSVNILLSTTRSHYIPCSDT